MCIRDRLYKEALNHAFDEPKQWEIREINEIMNQCLSLIHIFFFVFTGCTVFSSGFPSRRRSQLFIAVNNVIPVSYTHLDVYKRQIQIPIEENGITGSDVFISSCAPLSMRLEPRNTLRLATSKAWFRSVSYTHLIWYLPWESLTVSDEAETDNWMLNVKNRKI